MATSQQRQCILTIFRIFCNDYNIDTHFNFQKISWDPSQIFQSRGTFSESRGTFWSPGTPYFRRCSGMSGILYRSTTNGKHNDFAELMFTSCQTKKEVLFLPFW